MLCLEFYKGKGQGGFWKEKDKDERTNKKNGSPLLERECVEAII